MPTHGETDAFWRDWRRLTADQRERFVHASRHFAADLRSGQFRPGLRVKGYRDSATVFELTRAPNGRALWMYGDETVEGEPHVMWLRVGTHEIL